MKKRPSVWNSIVERNIDFLRTKGNELPSEYYAYNDSFVYFYYNNSATDYENFYVHERVKINEKNRKRIDRRVDILESIAYNRGYSDLVSFASQNTEGRHNSDSTVYERKSGSNDEYHTIPKTKGRESSNHDISGSDGIRSQTGEGKDESVSESGERVNPESKRSLPCVKGVGVRETTWLSLRESCQRS